MQVKFGKEFFPSLSQDTRENIQQEIISRIYYHWYCQARGDFDIVNYIEACKAYTESKSE